MERRQLSSHDSERTSGAATDALRSIRRRVFQLLPGAVMLFAFQLFVAQSGALSHLQPNEQAAFAVSLGSSALSIALLTIVILSRDLADDTHEGTQQAELTATVLLSSVGMLAGALAGDYFVVGSRLTGSAGIGGLAGATVLLLICVPSF